MRVKESEFDLSERIKSPGRWFCYSWAAKSEKTPDGRGNVSTTKLPVGTCAYHLEIHGHIQREIQVPNSD